MAKKNEKKVSVAEIESVMKEQFSKNTKTADWYGIEIEYKESIPMDKMVEFVDNVAGGCFGEDGEYLPEFKSFLIDAYMMEYYTNVRLPQSIEKQYVIFAQTDLADMIRQMIDKKQYFAILEAIDEKIAYIRDADVVATKQNVTKLITQIEGLAEQFLDSFDSLGLTNEFERPDSDVEDGMQKELNHDGDDKKIVVIKKDDDM